MSSIANVCSNIVDTLLRKRGSEEISTVLSDENINMWKEAVKPENSTRNKFITVHGNINETILTDEYCSGTNKDKTALSYTVPPGVIIVDLAQDNTVVFSNSSQDMEMAVFKSNPNWITTPTFGDIENPNFKDDIQIKTAFNISRKKMAEKLKNKFGDDIKNIVKSCPNSPTKSSIVKTVKDRSQCNYINKILNPQGDTDITIDDYRMAAQELKYFTKKDLNLYKISIKLVEEIDKYILKQEFGLDEHNLYKFDTSHTNFDPQGPDMVMYCTHIYFTGDEIHNKIMEWDHGRDFNVFNMIDTAKVEGPITKENIHNMLYDNAKKGMKVDDLEIPDYEMTDAYYLEHSIKEYPSQIINNIKGGGDYPLLEQCNEVNKTNFPNKNDNIGKPFQLKDLIKEIEKKMKPTNENPIIIYLNSCSPTIRNKDNLLLDHRTERNRRLVRRNILKSRLAIDKKYALKEAEINEDMNINNFLTKINIIKNDLYNKGRQNFIALRNVLKNNETEEEKEKRTVNELPRLHKTIVMMGVDERADWYKNVMGAFFSQLKKPNQGDYKSIQQDGMNVLYEQAKRDAFNRAIYVLYKNWKNYDDRSKENGWPKIEWPDDNSEQYNTIPIWMNKTAYGGRKKTRKRRKKRRRKKTRRKRKKRRRKKTRKRRRRTRRKR